MREPLSSSRATPARDREFNTFALATCFVSSTLFYLPWLLRVPVPRLALPWWIFVECPLVAMPLAYHILRLGDPDRTQRTESLVVITIVGTLSGAGVFLYGFETVRSLVELLVDWRNDALVPTGTAQPHDILDLVFRNGGIGAYALVLAVSAVAMVRRLRARRP